MNLKYGYPIYGIDLTGEMLQECCRIAARLLGEVGFVVRHKQFLDAIKGKDGIKIEGERVHFDEALILKHIEKFIAKRKEELERRKEKPECRKARPGKKESQSGMKKTGSDEWEVSVGGFSMAVIDINTDEVRSATCQDLRDLIKLANSFGIGGYYPVMPQDLPPLMRAIACFKICWESSDNIIPYDYLDIKQTEYIYEMHKVMGKTFSITLCVPSTLMIDEKDIEIFLKFYPELKKNRNIDFHILDYGMLGINKPITFPGSIAMNLANNIAVDTLFNLFDPEIEMPVSIGGGLPTDLRSVCWAFGSPRHHLFRFLNSRISGKLCGYEPEEYTSGSVLLESSSSMVDAQAAMEKMGVAMVAALQGVRQFGGAGSLCVDDLFSGVQFIIDVEIVNYIREAVESFNPHQDLMSIDGLYEMLRDVGLGKEQFLSHPDTVSKFRNILPSSDRLRREKLRSWLSHKTLLKDRAREECIERIKNQPEFHLPPDKQKALDKIYKRAETDLSK